LFEHDLFGKPVSTFLDHALAACDFGSAARLQDAVDRCASVDFARLPCYERRMNMFVRNVNRKHMTRFGWDVEGVAR
jgi:hypothetical protein